MDLNYLFHRHQISVMRAGVAATPAAALAHHGLARGYAGRIATSQQASGARAPTKVLGR